MVSHCHSPLFRVIIDKKGSLESAGHEPMQKPVAGIHGQTEARARRGDIGNRFTRAFPYRGCQKGVNVALVQLARTDAQGFLLGRYIRY